jgi:hypothetical protein
MPRHARPGHGQQGGQELARIDGLAHVYLESGQQGAQAILSLGIA